MDDIVTLVTAGGEMIGRLVEHDEYSITLEKPRAFVQTEKGVGFAPSVCLTEYVIQRKYPLEKAV